MKKAVKGFARYYLAAVVYLVLVFFLFRFAALARGSNTQLSLRYTDAPLTAVAVNNAKGYAADEKNDVPYGLSFWYQLQSTTIQNEFGASEAAVVYVDGEMESVYPVEFMMGGYPTGIDTHGIAVSEMLSWRLFGGENPIGSVLKWNDETYYVRGVFKGLDPIMLVQVDAAELIPDTSSGGDGTDNGFSGYTAQGIFTGLEFVGETQFGDPRTVVTGIAGVMGLGTPTAVVSGSAVADIMTALALLPALILCLWFLVKLLRQLHRLPFWRRQGIWFLVLLALAFAVPWAMGKLPGWMIPNKWSDLDSWSQFFTTMRGRINEWLSLYPSMRDVEMKKQLILQIALAVPALVAMLSIIRTWNERISGLIKPGRAEVSAEIDTVTVEVETEETTLPEEQAGEEYAEVSASEILLHVEERYAQEAGEDAAEKAEETGETADENATGDT